MNEPRRGRPPQRFSIRRVRLVAFHNFVDETIEIRDGGHLFLLGDNGSGKTTVLDAIHIVLTGTLGIELNAAARVAGGRDAGRTMQGIALRFDQERGVMNEGGAIAYAALELADDAEGSVVVGIGVEATTMEADVVRWGLLRRGRLEDVPLVETTPAGKVALPRERLREVLDKTEFFAHMSEYRRAIADRLFGGSALYEEVCRFWSMAKAYREIVAKARDFGTLFARLLPAPNRETFVDILRSARALDELEGVLSQLEQQRQFVAHLADVVREIRELREAIVRYRWLLTHRRIEESDSALEEIRRALSSRRLDAERERAAVREAQGLVAQAAAALSAARAADLEGLGMRLQQAEAQLARDEGDEAIAQSAVEQREARVREAERALADATRRRLDAWRLSLESARAAVDCVRTLGVPLAGVEEELAREQARILENASAGPLPPLHPAATREAEEARERARTALHESAHAVSSSEVRLEDARRRLAGLETRGEEAPNVTGFLAAHRALGDAGLQARSLYELLQPKGTAAKAALAAVEALVGDEVLAAFVVPEGDRDRARALIAPHASARLLVRTAHDAELPGWIADLFSARSGDEALRALATEIAQPASLGGVRPPDGLGDVEHRGLAFRVHAEEPRLLGTDARRSAHEKRLREARDDIAAAERERDARARMVTAAEERCAEAAALVDALEAMRGTAVLDAHHGLVMALVARGHEREQLADARARLEAVSRRTAEARSLVEALRARAREAGLEEVQRRIDELKVAEEKARSEERAAVGREVMARNDVQAFEKQQSDAVARVEALRAELVTRGADLRARLEGDLASADDAELARYVRTTQRGDQFKSIAHVEDRLRAAERDEAVRCAEVAGDGSRGVHNLQWAGRFGFSWLAPEARVEDRRGEPLANVLSGIEREISEQRGVINEKTRELMDKLVMGALARELQEHVERLHRTVREMNTLLDGLRFGSTRYQFRVTPRSDRAEVVALVRRLSLFDEASRASFRQFVDERLEDLKRLDDDTEVPELLDYRRWFDYRLSMRSVGAGDTELTRELRALGSGGEQGVPNYLLVLALARLMFDNADARARPLLFDEAFYGIDAGRRDQLLRFATDLGLQLVVASPDQDGVTPTVRRTTTLFLVRDDEGDVHLAPYHYFNDTRVAQRSLLDADREEPDSGQAVCALEGTPPAERTP